MEGVGDEKGNGAMNFSVVVAFYKALERSHKVRHDFFRDRLALQRIQKPLDDP